MEAFYVAAICVIYLWIGTQLVRWAENRSPELRYVDGWKQGRIVVTLSWPLVILVSFFAMIKRMWGERHDG